MEGWTYVCEVTCIGSKDRVSVNLQRGWEHGVVQYRGQPGSVDGIDG
jgi:hypothetical protein